MTAQEKRAAQELVKASLIRHGVPIKGEIEALEAVWGEDVLTITFRHDNEICHHVIKGIAGG
jgi:hypothetical protein